ncbi:hypothetical protein P691DRAFT_784691 [Macrolepiota fuliginosa MF-IS2]|uniref:BCAS3 WD40 domain-containing protein n=1 Tax=Macrolepiota fuliginosa MF-IS2 TaxID=1400762 RepID=A0A9P5XAM4_9AGAR|nr:hypothetical protein P691DRAFT_784691 [Macrolepiota fuliginosa MF-IS2]
MPRNAHKLSPPVPLPTPLPDIVAPEPFVASSALDHLIDFEISSPPFREAQLPDEYEYEYSRPETPPLPIPPRIHSQYHEDEEVRSAGHTRTPTLPRSPTRLQSLSRTIKSYAPQSAVSASAALRSSADALRTYVPSSIHIPVPIAAPSPPMVSRPLSFGRFSVDPEDRYQPQVYSGSHFHEASAPPNRPSSGVSRALGTDLASYPRSSTDTHADFIAWAHWDIVSQRRVLVIGYASGVQIWDCHDLGSVTEILNLTSPSEDWILDDSVGRATSFNTFVRAGVLPDLNDFHGDSLASYRPLLGILMSDSDSTRSAFFVYSLKTHQIVQRISLPGIASTFEANHHFIVISTTLPPTLLIFSASTFHTLWTLSSASLATFSPVSNVSLAPQGSPIDQQQPPAPSSIPVFALSNRLLAYASPSPQQSSRRVSTSSAGSGPSLSLSSVPSSPFGGFSQSDLGNAAIKVGGSVLSGMKFLGGIAYEAAKNRIVEGSTASPTGNGKFFSRSAPTDERPFSMTTSTTTTTTTMEQKQEDNVVAPHTNPVVDSGYYVTVVDLKDLLERRDKPAKIAEFKTSRSQPVAQLAFTKDGCKLVTVPENGQVTRVFMIRPRRAVVGDGDEKVGDGVRLYDLRRGRTSVFVEGVDSARDGRWVAIATRNRTVHVFPTNPFGGRPDVLGHLQGKVKNVDELQPHLVEVTPLVRLRPVKASKVEMARAALAFTFIQPGDVHIPMSLCPPLLSKFTSDPTSSPPPPVRRPGNVQDVLVFDPADGMLSLRRITLDQRPRDQLGLVGSVSTSAMVGMVSRSMPGAVSTPVGGGGAGVRLSASPSTGAGALSISRASSSTSTTTTGGGAQVQEVMELVGQGILVATWNLQRKRDWEEIRKPVGEGIVSRQREGFSADWLARAELSTCSRSPRILPRSLYLSHQFTFWTLGEDYHALLRQYHFDVRGSKIHVRREVQVSVGVGLNNTSDRFVEDLDLQQLRHGGGAGSSSFDEPLASALAGDLVSDYAGSVPTILPMYPNGASGHHRSLSIGKTPAAAFIRNSIPIRRIGDGMSEGLGRIRKEISSSYYQRKGESPGLQPRRDGMEDVSVPLEFDEEDEDFLGVSRDDAPLGTTGVSAESGTSGTSVSVNDTDAAPPTPDTTATTEDLWKGWESREVGQAVEEMERFDDISVVGFLDEEHQREKEAREREARERAAAGGRVKKGRKGKKKVSAAVRDAGM